MWKQNDANDDDRVYRPSSSYKCGLQMTIINRKSALSCRLFWRGIKSSSLSFSRVSRMHILTQQVHSTNMRLFHSALNGIWSLFSSRSNAKFIYVNNSYGHLSSLRPFPSQWCHSSAQHQIEQTKNYICCVKVRKTRKYEASHFLSASAWVIRELLVDVIFIFLIMSRWEADVWFVI